MKDKNRDLNEIATKRIAVAIREVSEKNKVDQQKTTRALQGFLIVKGRVPPKGRELDLLLPVLHKIRLSAYDIFKLGNKLNQKDILDMEDLKRLMIPTIQEELTCRDNFKNFLKGKRIKNTPLPETIEDLDKIPRLEKLPPEEFEDFIIKIANNLNKVSLDILGILIPEILEVMGPPTKLPPGTASKLIGYVRTIVEWEAKLHGARTDGA